MSSDSPPKSALAQFSTNNIADALIRLGYPQGGYLPAYTVRLGPAQSTNERLRTPVHWLDTLPSGHFIVLDAPAHLKSAVWGGIRTEVAKARSAVGVVASGLCRDLDELDGFPIFARGRSCLGCASFTSAEAINIPVVIHPQYSGIVAEEDRLLPMTVEPGDWIVADVTGVVCVPRALESQVVEYATKGQDIEGYHKYWIAPYRIIDPSPQILNGIFYNLDVEPFTVESRGTMKKKFQVAGEAERDIMNPRLIEGI